MDVLYKVDGAPVERLPTTTGVYRFFSQDNVLLYVGKTIDFRARIRAHYQTARKEARHAKMMQGVSRIECETTSSELTALLFESRAVKIEQPLFNRRLRKKRQLWSARLRPDTEGYLGVYPQKLTSIDQLRSGYGLFSNQTHLKNWLRTAATEHRLCVQRIGLDRGKGRCFGRQINRCDGACTGEQSAQQFNDVLADILYRYQLAVWPYTDPIWIRERDANQEQLSERGGEDQPNLENVDSEIGDAESMLVNNDWHVFHYWTYLGSFSEPQEIDSDLSETIADGLDRDAYRILLSFLRNEKLNLFQFDPRSNSLKPIDNRFA